MTSKEEQMKSKDNSLMCHVNKQEEEEEEINSIRYEKNTLPELLGDQINVIV